jgi:hypothetical protein
MNGADRPSRVKAPATPIASPVARYASSSASEVAPNRTVVAATPDARRPVGSSITQWPVNRVPDRLRMARSHSRAWPSDDGFPWGRPSNSSRESQATTTAVPDRPATARALRSARTETRVAVSPAPMPSSSMPLTTTTGSNPASLRRRRRAGEPEARTSERSAMTRA